MKCHSKKGGFAMEDTTYRQGGDVLGLILQNVYPVAVDYDRSIEDSVRAGNYRWIDQSVTSYNFPSTETGSREVNIELIHFGQKMENDSVLHEMGKHGLRPATLKELLALGEKHPYLQREFSIIALGSIWKHWNSCLFYVCLGKERLLYITEPDREWGSGCYFAAVRK